MRWIQFSSSAMFWILRSNGNNLSFIEVFLSKWRLYRTFFEWTWLRESGIVVGQLRFILCPEHTYIILLLVVINRRLEYSKRSYIRSRESIYRFVFSVRLMFIPLLGLIDYQGILNRAILKAWKSLKKLVRDHLAPSRWTTQGAISVLLPLQSSRSMVWKQ